MDQLLTDQKEYAEDIAQNATHIETESVQIRDPHTGGAVVLRHFFFKSLPLPKGEPKPDKHQIVSHYKKLIEMNLWGDGLIIREDKPVEVHTIQRVKSLSKALYMKMKNEGSDFVILCLAAPRAGVNLNDKTLIAY